MEKIIICGASGHAKVIIDVIEKQKQYEISGIFEDTPGMVGTKFLGYPVLGKIVDFNKNDKGIVAVGDNYVRHQVVERIKNINNKFQFICAIHPSAVIGESVRLGEGTFVAAGAIINAHAVIGKHCIINTLSSVDHDVIIGDFSTAAPGSHIGGSSVIGAFSTISMGVNVIQRIKIGAGTLIGAGSTVIKDIPEGVLAFGTPAKVIRQRKIDEKYL